LEVVGNDRTSFTCAEHAVDEDIRVGMGHGFALSVSREPGMTSVRDVTDGSERRAVPTGLGSPVAAITQDFRPGLYYAAPLGLAKILAANFKLSAFTGWLCRSRAG
jgi:hypothetical protein